MRNGRFARITSDIAPRKTNRMLNKLPSLVILGMLIAGCGSSAEPDPQGPTNGTGATAPDGQKTDPTGSRDPGNAQGPSHGKKPDAAAKPDDGRNPKPAEKPDGAQKPAGKEKPSKEPLGPTCGLPLEIDLGAPEVPKKLEGPTPPDQLKKK